MNIQDLNIFSRFLVDADSTSLTAANLLIFTNNALETCVSKILGADGVWQFDDTNFTDLPIGTGTLVNDQSSYSFADEFLELLSVQVKDVNGKFYYLSPIDESQRDDVYPLSTLYETKGMPIYYDVQGDTIKLYPAPDNGVTVTLASGLKVGFKRTADLFTSAQVTTGTKSPGIASPFHQLIAYMAALPYAISYKPDRVPLFEQKIREMTDDMIRFYSRRNKDERKGITIEPITFR